MPIWILATLGAALVQTLRLMLQKRLTGLGLTAGGATLARFLWAAPLAWAAALMLAPVGGMPDLTARFWAFALAGGVAQILGTLATVALFSERSFAVGIAFTKSEPVLVAVFSALILAEPVGLAALAAIGVGTAGLVVLARPARGWGEGGLWSRATGLGLAAGAAFGLSAIGYRGATLAVPGDALFRATLTLAWVTTSQTAILGLWLAAREPATPGAVLRGWRDTLPVGVTGVIGSGLWFLAFAVMNAAYVRALGQVELIFSALASVLWFRERLGGRDLAGMALLALGVLGLVTRG